jgi:hypothetical protein
VTNVITIYADDNVELSSWCGITIDTARLLLTYIAVFLLLILILFNFSVRGESKKLGNCEDDSTVGTMASDDFPVTSEVASAPSTAHPVQQYCVQISSISMQANIIPENSVAPSLV